MPQDVQDGSFSMSGARAAMATGLVHIGQQVESIERNVTDKTGLVFDLARTLVESTCRTILEARNQTFTFDDDLPKLFKAVAACVPFLPAEFSGEAEVRKSLRRVIGGLTNALHGICELRGSCGFASHGSSKSKPQMDSVQAILAAQAADAIVAFLYGMHSGDHAIEPCGTDYSNNIDFNEFVDECNDIVRIFELEYAPSEVLFRTDCEAYRDLLGSFAAEPGADNDLDNDEGENGEDC